VERRSGAWYTMGAGAIWRADERWREMSDLETCIASKFNPGLHFCRGVARVC
jgi:hypothetical protein